jgi:O-acetyl-ADP-ribose deacetylase (regulator of RNase III)
MSPVMRLAAVATDITTLRVDAVVNAANERLAGGGGVDGAIHRAAGRAELARACREIGGCPTGQVRVTPGFALRARWIIHAVGPVWRGGGHGEDEALASCYREAVAAADRLGAKTVAFPAISTGIFGFPAERAADIAISTLLASPTCSLELAILVAYDRRTFACYRAKLVRSTGDQRR